MSQAINTFSVNPLNSSAGANAIAKQRVRSRHLIDGLVAMVLLAAVVICVSVYWRTSAEVEAATARHQAAAARVDELKVENDKLEREIKSLRTDKDLIESLARRELGLVRPGDVVIKVEPGRDSTGGPVETRSNLTPRSGKSYTDAFN